MDGFKFRRQHPIDVYIADFYCHEAKLIVELDGGLHNKPENKEYDQGRTNKLNELEIRVVRFKNEDVVNNMDWVLDRVRAFLKP